MTRGSADERRGRRGILVVDDEAHTRLTLQQALGPLGYQVRLAATPQEAIVALGDSSIELVLLDLKMPGGSGLDVLRHIERHRPGLRVVMITAHGTVDSAVESMKLGALDLIQKPFSVEEIRRLVEREMDESRRASTAVADYLAQVEQARDKVRRSDFAGAIEHLTRAIDEREDRPEAFNLLGVVEEVRGDKVTAQRHWRMALLVSPTYEPAKKNLHRTVSRSGGAPDLG
ncbi:MAG: response regulator [Longimicrobiales bacterium]